MTHSTYCRCEPCLKQLEKELETVRNQMWSEVPTPTFHVTHYFRKSERAGRDLKI